MVFTVLTLAQMAHALAIRSERESLFRLGLNSNRMLLGAVLLTFLLQVAIIYLPALQRIFKTQALSLVEFGVCLALSLLVLVAVEAEKYLVRRGYLYESDRGPPHTRT